MTHDSLDQRTAPGEASMPAAYGEPLGWPRRVLAAAAAITMIGVAVGHVVWRAPWWPVSAGLLAVFGAAAGWVAYRGRTSRLYP